MKLQRLQTLQRLPIPIGEAWDFFSRPQNLRLITPHWLDFRLTNEPPEAMNPGTIISYKVRPVLGIPVQWITEITHMDAPRSFVDDQRVGPFRLWHHEHFFRPIEGGVEVEDQVHYGLPFGLLGSLVHELYLRKRLQEIFTYRAQTLEHRFGAWRPAQSANPASAAGLKSATRPISLKDIYGS
jgi:ligand-binding SRPBCC domain-containing protein